MTSDTDELDPKDASDTVDVTQNPDYTITKVADRDSVDAAGQVIGYTITLTNTGNQSLTNVTVTDPLLGALTGPAGDDDSDNELDVDEVWTYTGSYMVTQDEIDDWISSSEAQRILKRGTTWVNAACRDGRLVAERGAGRTSPWRVSRSVTCSP